MMDKAKIIEFFDSLAPEWDKNQHRNEAVINFILDKSGVSNGVSVLDVASGTGILFSDYLKREVGSVTGIDISSQMLKVAKDKFPGVKLICGDAENYNFDEKYDVIMIYNAFPHFYEPEKLFYNLNKALKNKGRITVAHGASMADIDKCHEGSAKGVSHRLPSAEVLSEMMSGCFDVDVIISDDSMYMVSGVKNN